MKSIPELKPNDKAIIDNNPFWTHLIQQKKMKEIKIMRK